ncbi:MAG: GAF domain-containing protein [Candidatus Limnocylindria bacterium]
MSRVMAREFAGGRAFAVLAALAAYLIAALTLEPVFGPIVFSLGIAPVCTAAWAYGWRAGIISAALMMPFNFLLALVSGTSVGAALFQSAPGYAALAGTGAFVGWASAQSRRQNALRLELDQQVADFGALATIGARVGGQALSGSVLRTIVDAAAELVRAPSTAIMLPASNGTELLLVAGAGESTVWIGTKRPSDTGVSGRAYRTGKTQIVSDVRADPDYFAAWPSSGSAISLPILGAKSVLGVLHLEAEKRAAFGDRERRLLEALAGHVAIALDTESIVRDLREADLRIVRTMLAHVPFTVFTIDRDRRTAPALAGGLSHVAVTRQQINGIPVADIIAGAASPECDAAFRGETRSGVTRFGGRTLQFHLVPLADSGPIERVIGVAIDITAEETALVTQELLDNERTAVLEQVPSGVLVLDAGGALLSMNGAARALIGEFAEGAPLSERIQVLRIRDADTGAPLERTPLRRVVDGELVPPTDVLMRHPDSGADRVVRVTGRSLADGRIIAVFTDVTEQWQLIRDLAATKQEQELIYDGLGCGVVVRDARGEVIRSNQLVHELYGSGFDTVNAAGELPAVAIRREDGSAVSFDELPAIEAGRTRLPIRGARLEMRRQGDASRWVQVDAVPIIVDGQVTHVVSTWIDITDLKRTQALGVQAGPTVHR